MLDFMGIMSLFVSSDDGVTLVMVNPVQILVKGSLHQLVGCLLKEKSLYCGLMVLSLEP